MEQRVSLVTLGTADLDRAKAFYELGGMTLAHNVRSRAEVDDILARAADAGATITQPARETFYGGYAGFFADPDGHIWEVAHNPGFTVDDEGRLILPDFGASHHETAGGDPTS
jgi:uncharacterized glyoxalase superfamily protein PhnB